MTCVLWSYGNAHNPSSLFLFARLTYKIWKNQLHPWLCKVAHARTLTTFQTLSRIHVTVCPSKTKPEQWGPPVWTLIHQTSALYDPLKHKYFVKWLQTLALLLPCAKCRANFVRMLGSESKASQLAQLRTKAEFSKFCFDLHSEVNQKHRSAEKK